MTSTETDGIRVVVRPSFWKERSDPQEGRFAFSYAVEVTNVGTEPARLSRRHWIITDGNGHIEEVEGAGVVGQTPQLMPGQRFTYSSWAMLRTPYGSMSGHYTMVRPDGESFRAVVGEFVLAQPNSLN